MRFFFLHHIILITLAKIIIFSITDKCFSKNTASYAVQNRNVTNNSLYQVFDNLLLFVICELNEPRSAKLTHESPTLLKHECA